jgi:hypothetical protein
LHRKSEKEKKHFLQKSRVPTSGFLSSAVTTPARLAERRRSRVVVPASSFPGRRPGHSRAQRRTARPTDPRHPPADLAEKRASRASSRGREEDVERLPLRPHAAAARRPRRVRVRPARARLRSRDDARAQTDHRDACAVPPRARRGRARAGPGLRRASPWETTRCGILPGRAVSSCAWPTARPW